MPNYPIGVTKSIGTWNTGRHHMERILDNATYDAAHPDCTALFAGPARRGSVNTKPGASGRTLAPIGMLQSLALQSNAPVAPSMAIGSARAFMLRGKGTTSWTISRVLLNGRNLLRVLYHNAVEAGVDASRFDDPATLDGSRNDQYFINLDSELFYIPFGIGGLMRTKSHTFVGGFYLELNLLNGHSFQIVSGQASIVETVSGMCDRVMPFKASDAMSVPGVGRAVMDAVLGLAPTIFPDASYAGPATFDDTATTDPSVPAL